MSDRFRVYGLEELFGLDLPETDWRVDQILPCAACGLLSAREKAGKGLITVDLLSCIAEEVPFLDRAVKGGSVAYFAAEESLALVRERIGARIGSRRDLPFAVIPLNGFVTDPDTPPERLRLDDPVAMLRLYNTIKGEGFDVVVLDTLRELHDRAENESDEMGPLLRPLRQMTHELSITLLVNHHMNKVNGFRGSTAIRAAFDFEWAFVRTDREEAPLPQGSLTIEGRFGPKQTLHIAHGPGMRWGIANAPIEPSTDASLRDRILGWLVKCHRWQTAEEIAQTLIEPNYKLKTVQNTLAAIAGEKPCPIAVSGTGKRNDPRRYHCLSPGLDLETVPDGSGKSGNQRGNSPFVPFVPEPLKEGINFGGINGTPSEARWEGDSEALDEAARRILVFTHDELLELRRDLAKVSPDDPDGKFERAALALAEQMRAANPPHMNGEVR